MFISANPVQNYMGQLMQGGNFYFYFCQPGVCWANGDHVDVDDDIGHLKLDALPEQVEEVGEVGAAALVREQLVVHDLTHPDVFVFVCVSTLVFVFVFIF